MGFNDVTAAGQDFAEGMMGESFTYATRAGTETSGLVGVFNQVEVDLRFEDGSIRPVTQLICVASKTQWGATVPENRGKITYGGVQFTIEQINGTTSSGEPAYELTCKRLT